MDSYIVTCLGCQNILHLGLHSEITCLRFMERGRGCQREGMIYPVVLKREIDGQRCLVSRLTPAAGEGKDELGSKVESEVVCGQRQLNR